MNVNRSWFLSCSFTLCGLASPLTYGQVVIVVNPAYTGAAATSEQIGDIFLSKADSLPGGTILFPVDQLESSTARETFYRSIANRDAAQMKAYWARLIFTGKTKPPPVLQSDAEVKQHVSKHANAIGYIAKASLDPSVKVLLTP